MQKLEAGSHVVVKGRFLFKRAFTTLRDNSHRKLLSTHVPDGTFDVNDGRRTEETFFTTIGFLSDGGV